MIVSWYWHLTSHYYYYYYYWLVSWQWLSTLTCWHLKINPAGAALGMMYAHPALNHPRKLCFPFSKEFALVSNFLHPSLGRATLLTLWHDTLVKQTSCIVVLNFVASPTWCNLIARQRHVGELSGLRNTISRLESHIYIDYIISKLMSAWKFWQLFVWFEKKCWLLHNYITCIPTMML